MSRSIIVVIVFSMALAMQAFAQQNEKPLMNDDQPPPQNENDRPGVIKPLTDKQKEQITIILSKYDASTLTSDDAKAIHEAFRQVGLRGGPATDTTIREAGFDPYLLHDLAPPPDRDRNEGRGRYGNKNPPQKQTDDSSFNMPQERQGDQKYSIEQAVSDRAQLHTIAFSGLAFITGEFGASTFIPPGKVSDFFGFQYLRDIDAAGKGHNPMFLNRVVGNVMHILNDKQRKLFFDLAKTQTKELKSFALKRLPLIKAFHRELDGELPHGSSGLNRDAVVQYVGELFILDAKMSYARAETFGKVAFSLTTNQKKYLEKMEFGDFNTWPDVDEQSSIIRGKEHLFNVAYMTFGSEFFSWYAGSITADTYFCPERHGTYFGGFYMKDMPAMGKRDYDISTAITGNSGEAFLNLLNAEQRSHISIIMDRQRKQLQKIVKVRQAISKELRKFLKGKRADKNKVLALGKRYGELDGELSWLYATAFAKVNQTLTAGQRAKLKKLRNVNGYMMAPAYLYSSPMKELPELPNTDHFFFALN